MMSTKGDESDATVYVGRDVPDDSPVILIPLNQVGIERQARMISVEDLDSSRSRQKDVYCEVSLCTDLHGDRRGIHASRFIEVLNEVSTGVHCSVGHYALALADSLRATQACSYGKAYVRAFYFRTVRSPVTKLSTYELIHLLAEAVARPDSQHLRIGLSMPIITACPCTQEFSRAAAASGLLDEASRLPVDHSNEGRWLPPTHSQRGLLTVLLDDDKASIPVGDLLALAKSSVHGVYDLLKRPDEYELVKQAFSRPQFCEDVARQMAQAIWDHYGNQLASSARLTVDVLSEESIHPHVLRAQIDMSLGEFAEYLRASAG